MQRNLQLKNQINSQHLHRIIITVVFVATFKPNIEKCTLFY